MTLDKELCSGSLAWPALWHVELLEERIGKLVHLIVIAAVFGLEPVDRNQGSAPELLLPLPVS